MLTRELLDGFLQDARLARAQAIVAQYQGATLTCGFVWTETPDVADFAAMAAIAEDIGSEVGAAAVRHELLGVYAEGAYFLVPGDAVVVDRTFGRSRE